MTLETKKILALVLVAILFVSTTDAAFAQQNETSGTIIPKGTSVSKAVVPIYPQESNPQVVADAKLALKLMDEIKNARTGHERKKMEDQLKTVEKELEGLGLPTTTEYQKNPSYWESRGFNATSAIQAKQLGPKISTMCGCQSMMQFEEGFSYSCFEYFTCEADYPAWEYLQPGQSGEQNVEVQNSYSSIQPFWRAVVDGDTQGTYSWQYYATDPYGNITEGPIPGQDTATMTWYDSAYYFGGLPTLQNVQPGSTVNAWWNVMHIP